MRFHLIPPFSAIFFANYRTLPVIYSGKKKQTRSINARSYSKRTSHAKIQVFLCMSISAMSV